MSLCGLLNKTFCVSNSTFQPAHAMSRVSAVNNHQGYTLEVEFTTKIRHNDEAKLQGRRMRMIDDWTTQTTHHSQPTIIT